MFLSLTVDFYYLVELLKLSVKITSYLN